VLLEFLSVFDYLLLFVQYDLGQLSTSCMKLVSNVLLFVNTY